MTKAYIAVLIVIAAIAFGAIWHTKAPSAFAPGGAQGPAAGTSVTVEALLGQSVEALGEIITPKKVIEDSRCASDVQCIWAGTVRVDGTVRGGMGEGTLTFELDKMNTTEVNEITLVDVKPYPLSTHEIRADEYIFTFVVTRR